MPTNADKFELYKWYANYPIHYLTQATTPDCQNLKYRNWYGVTFFMSMVWISFYSYIMVWMITVIGESLFRSDGAKVRRLTDWRWMIIFRVHFRHTGHGDGIDLRSGWR